MGISKNAPCGRRINLEAQQSRGLITPEGGKLLGCSVGQEGSRLHVGRLGEQIEGAKGPDPKSPVHQDAKVPSQGGGVTGDVDHLLGGQVQDALQHLGMASPTGRIQHHAVKGVSVQLFQDILRLARKDR